jgi:hydrogenase expression/formation protein HypC
MCLAVPGKVIDWLEHTAPFSTASVEFAGVRRQVCMACVPEAVPGDYVLVHAGIAISRIDPQEAAKVLTTFEQLDQSQSEGETAEWRKAASDQDG